MSEESTPTTTTNEESWGETCQRCGEKGEDRRTLWMSCFYAMEELGLPFEQRKLMGKLYPMVGTEELKFLGRDDPNFPPHTIPKYADEPNGAFERAIYSLRVCKSCRGDWMAAIKFWFNTAPDRQESCGSGIFVREYGKTVEITREEWEARRKKLP